MSSRSTASESLPLVLPSALAAEVEAAAAEEHRPALDGLQDAVKRYIAAKQSPLPACVQERAQALGLTGGVGVRRLVRKVSEMSAAELEAIGNSEMDARHNPLDADLT
jgi:hypothetical protein